LGKWDPYKLSIRDFFTATYSLFEMLALEEKTQVNLGWPIFHQCFYLFQTEQSDVFFTKFPDFSCVKRVFYSAFVWKCTYMCKHRFGVQL
jgi:hypothetical protein